MYGEYFKSIDSQLLSVLVAFLWLTEGDAEPEVESEIIAAQDLAQRTKCYATKIFRAGTDIKRRICEKYEKTVNHGIGKRT
jgi:hypothetical protein